MAVAIVAAAYLLRLSLVDALDMKLSRYIIISPAVILASLFFGLGPGLLATAAGVFLMDYFVLPPAGFGIAKTSDRISLLIFALMSLLVCVLSDRFRQHLQRNQFAELQLRQTEMLRLSFDPILIMDDEGHIEMWNKRAEQLYGYSESEVLGQDTHKLLQTWPALLWPQIAAILRERGLWECELRQFTKDGRQLKVCARYQFITGPDGQKRIVKVLRELPESPVPTPLS